MKAVQPDLGRIEPDSAPYAYGDDVSYRAGADFLRDCSSVEDWGCGRGYARQFFRQKYTGVDMGCDSVAGANHHAHKLVADLADYTSNTSGIFLRHVLEHNWRWREILSNALRSCEYKLFLCLYTPLLEDIPADVLSGMPHFPQDSSEQKVLQLNGKPLYDPPVPNLSLSRVAITNTLLSVQPRGIAIRHEAVEVSHSYKIDHCFFIEKT